MSGTASVKYNPVVEADADDSDPNLLKIENIKYVCITAMEEYRNKSLDELRLEDYSAHRGGPGFAFSSSAFYWRPQNTPFGDASPTATPSGTTPPPLTFHSVHDVNARVFGGGTKARRVTSFNRAIVFSSRPVQVNEKVYILLVTVTSNWKGNISLGFTSNDPATFVDDFENPSLLSHNITNKPGTWVGPVEDKYCEEKVILYYYFNSGGQIRYGVNGEEKGLLRVGIDVEKTLSAVVDIFANCTCVQLVNPKNPMHNLQDTGTFRPRLAIGTALARYLPVVGYDVIIKSGTSQNITVNHHCITVMKEYEEKSLEELRLEDYSVGRKGPVKLFGQIQCQPEHVPVFGGTRSPWHQQTRGTALAKYVPVVGTDVVIIKGTSRNKTVNHLCITVMKEYEEKSLEELRLEDYSAGRKGPVKLFGQLQWQPERAPVFGGTSSLWEQQTMGTASEKFVPFVDSDVEVQRGCSRVISVKYQCIIFMQKYRNKSLEELRLEDYSANRKGPATVFGSPDLLSENKTPFSPFSFSFGSHLQDSEKSLNKHLSFKDFLAKKSNNSSFGPDFKAKLQPFESLFSPPNNNNASSSSPANNASSSSTANTTKSGQKDSSSASTAPNFGENPFSNVSLDNFISQLKNNNAPWDFTGNTSINGQKDPNSKGNPFEKLACFENFFSQARTQNVENASSKFSDTFDNSCSSSGPELKQIPVLKPISFESLFSQSRTNDVSSNSHGNASENGSTSRNSNFRPELKPLPYIKPISFKDFFMSDTPFSFVSERTAGDGNSRNSSAETQRNTASGNIPDKTGTGTSRISSGKPRKDGEYTSTPEDILRLGVERVSISGTRAEQILDKVRAAHNTSETTTGNSENPTSNPSSGNTSSGTSGNFTSKFHSERPSSSTSGTFTSKFRSDRPSSTTSGNFTSKFSTGQQATGSSSSGNPTSSSSSDQQPERRYSDAQMDAVRRIENATNNYGILGVPAGSDRATIEAAHSRLKKLLHPDKNKAPGSREAFVKLNRAASALL